MRAAGGLEASDPVPSHSRNALLAILTLCHRVCLSPDLSEEWKRHQSRLARRWLTQMYANRKIITCAPSPCDHILADIRSFRTSTPSDITAVEKDIHLAAAALTTDDRTILSNDNRVAVAIRKVCSDTGTVTSRTIARILWINPVADHDPLRIWLSEQGPIQPLWPLGVALAPVPVTRSSNRSMQRDQQ